VSRCPETRGKQSQSGSRNGPLAVKQPGLVYILPAEVEASDESSKIDKYVENCVAGVHGKLIHCCVANQTTFIGESDNGRSPQVATTAGRTEARRYEHSTLYVGPAVLGCLNLNIGWS
jgi:hypothetical protein